MTLQQREHSITRKEKCSIQSVEMEHFNQCWALKGPGVILLLAAFETSQAFHDIASFPCLNQWLILLACLFLFLAASRNSKLHVSIFSLMSHTSLPEVTVHSPMCFSVCFFPLPSLRCLINWCVVASSQKSAFAKEVCECIHVTCRRCDGWTQGAQQAASCYQDGPFPVLVTGADEASILSLLAA